MKKMLFISLVIVAVLMMGVSSAFAAGYKIDTGWAAGDGTEARHSGYATTTNACKACHDVHGAQEISAAGAVLGTPSANLKLYRWDTVGAGCDACHLGATALSGVKVYQSVGAEAEHTIGAGLIPDSVADAGIAGGGVANALDCFDCHNAAPHGVNGGVVATNALITGYDLTTDAGVNAYCGAKCHDLNDKVGETSTHSLVAADGVHAFGGAESCYKCHTSVGDVAQEFPHQDTVDYAFLGSNTMTDATLDPKCISCHINGVVAGVGITY